MDEHPPPGQQRQRSEPNQQRGRDRRRALLRAALQLLADGGVKAVTHRAVAARAGLPLASTTYYFRSIEQLTKEALLLGVEERVTQLQAFTNAAAPLGDNADELGQAFVAAVIARPRTDILAQLEMYLEAARNPALQEVAGAAIGSFEAIAARALATVSARESSTYAIAVSALIDGFAIHRVVRPLPADYEQEVMTDALRALFVAHAADDDEQAEWQARLRREFTRSE